MAISIAITPDELKKLDDEHGGVTVAVRDAGLWGPQGPKWVCVFRAPTRTEWKRFVQTREKDLHSAVEALFHSTCIFPDRAKRDELLDAPGCVGVPFACIEHISKLIGSGGDELGK